MNFAFFIMGDFSEEDRAAIGGGRSQIVGVRSKEEAARLAPLLVAGGVGCIELCGAFGEEGARMVIAATNNAIPVGYVTHLPGQDALYREAFPDDAQDCGKEV